MSFSNRIFIYGPVALLVLAAAFYSLYWKVSADMLSARLDRANGGEIMPGVLFAFAEKSVGGFPFRLDVTLEGVTFAHTGPSGQTAWRAEKLAIHALSYAKNKYILEAAGLQSFARPGENGVPPHVVYLTPAVARASAIFVAGELARFDIDLWDVEGKEATLGAAADRTFKAGRAQFHLLGNRDKTISTVLKIETIEIGGGYHTQLGPKIALIDAKGRIKQGQAFDAFRKGSQSPIAAIDAWRKSGGEIDVESLALHWNGAVVNAKGALVLAPDNGLSGTLRGGMTGLKALASNVEDALPVKEPVAVSVTIRDGELRISADLLAGFVPGP